MKTCYSTSLSLKWVVDCKSLNKVESRLKTTSSFNFWSVWLWGQESMRSRHSLSQLFITPDSSEMLVSTLFRREWPERMTTPQLTAKAAADSCRLHIKTITFVFLSSTSAQRSVWIRHSRNAWKGFMNYSDSSRWPKLSIHVCVEDSRFSTNTLIILSVKYAVWVKPSGL